jgi:hypothetical protein
LGGTEDDYLLEFRRIANTVKVTAVDPVSGTEVSIVGPANAGREYLSRTAVRKLQYVMAKKQDKKPAPGIWV